MHQYHHWNSSAQATFSQRATSNYVETFTFNEDGSPIAERTRGYLDPMGRAYQTLSQVTPDAFNAALGNTMVHSGRTVYDNWNRISKQYKPFVHGNGSSPVNFTPRLHSTNSNYPNAFVVSMHTKWKDEIPRNKFGIKKNLMQF